MPAQRRLKNTYISLDLLFISDRGAMSTALAVLERKGGACDRLGIKVGDTVLHPELPASR